MRLWPFKRRQAEPEGPTLSLDPERLRASMLAFLRAGGTVGLADFLGMPEPLQAALERAGTALWAERALAIGAALHGGEAAEAVAAAADGGRASDETAVQRAMDLAIRMVPTGPRL